MATPTPASKDTSNSDSTWAWIITALAIVAVVALVALLVAHQRRERRMQLWRQQTRGAVEDARLVQQLLAGATSGTADRDRWSDVRGRSEQAAAALDGAASAAPNEPASVAARGGAQSLRDLVFAIEAARLLQGATPPPSAEQLAEADRAVRSRRADLEQALGRLESLVVPPSAAT